MSDLPEIPEVDLSFQIEPPEIAQFDLGFRTITLVFLPDDSSRIEDTLHMAEVLTANNEMWLARHGEYDRLVDGLAAASRTHLIYNMTGALALLCSVFERHAEDMAEGFIDPDGTPLADNWIPITSIMGRNLPADAAAVIRFALDKIIKEVDPSMERWQALELLAADSLGGM